MSGAITTGPAAVKMLPDKDYLDGLLACIRQARRRLLCSIFIVDLTPARDPDGLVHQLLIEIAGAAWRGLDVRLLIGGSRINLELARLAAVASGVSNEYGIDCRWLTRFATRGSHDKMVVADDRVLTGSHNWSIGAFTDQTQDSVLVESEALAEYLAHTFDSQWARSEAAHADV